jgi:hypothetical protein
VTNTLYVQYVGFVSKPRVREYTFSVKEGGDQAREFQFTISNEAFLSNRARYQDAPDICSQRLHVELAGASNHPEKTHYTITDAEIDDYRTAHTPKAKPSWQKYRPSEQ